MLTFVKLPKLMFFFSSFPCSDSLQGIHETIRTFKGRFHSMAQGALGSVPEVRTRDKIIWYLLSIKPSTYNVHLWTIVYFEQIGKLEG